MLLKNDMQIIILSLFSFFVLLLNGCGYTQVDWPAITPPPPKPIYVYADSSEVPFAFKEIGVISQSIPFSVFRINLEPTESEKALLLSRLKTESRYHNADGLINVRFFCKQFSAGVTRPRIRGTTSYGCRASGSAMMIRRVGE